MTLTTVPCAVCGGIDFTLVYPATISDPEADPALYYSSSRVTGGLSGCGALPPVRPAHDQSA